MAVTIDEYSGQGGSYLLDPKTGKRKLVERTQPGQSQPEPEVTSDAAPVTQAPDPEQDRDDVRD
jgi:hypothetical protein